MSGPICSIILLTCKEDPSGKPQTLDAESTEDVTRV
jgi:hypothetical protein